jgi:hypothetical protein
MGSEVAGLFGEPISDAEMDVLNRNAAWRRSQAIYAEMRNVMTSMVLEGFPELDDAESEDFAPCLVIDVVDDMELRRHRALGGEHV